MKRREFITLLGGAAAAWPLAARAQQPRMPVIGVLHSTSPSLFGAAFQRGLREAGYIEGQNVRMEFRGAKGAYAQLPALAAELVAVPVDVIYAPGTPAARVAKTASLKTTPAVPVVFAMASDPVTEGFVESLNRPGGNITGVTSIAGALAPKRLDLVREFLRDGDAVGILLNPVNPLSKSEQREAELAAGAIGQRLEIVAAASEGEIDKAFATIKERHIGALIIAADIFFYSQMQRLATLTSQYAVPAIGPLREFAAEGGLLSYGANIDDVTRQAGIIVGKVLKGAQPSDLPVQQPTKFELVLNLKTAKRLGIELSPRLLALADDVIE
jgi:putative tryptophan/tyrosine transport system substrate-binding protein